MRKLPRSYFIETGTDVTEIDEGRSYRSLGRYLAGFVVPPLSPGLGSLGRLCTVKSTM